MSGKIGATNIVCFKIENCMLWSTFIVKEKHLKHISSKDIIRHIQSLRCDIFYSVWDSLSYSLPGNLIGSCDWKVWNYSESFQYCLITLKKFSLKNLSPVFRNIVLLCKLCLIFCAIVGNMSQDTRNRKENKERKHLQ